VVMISYICPANDHDFNAAMAKKNVERRRRLSLMKWSMTAVCPNDSLHRGAFQSF